MLYLEKSIIESEEEYMTIVDRLLLSNNALSLINYVKDMEHKYVTGKYNQIMNDLEVCKSKCNDAKKEIISVKHMNELIKFEKTI